MLGFFFVCLKKKQLDRAMVSLLTFEVGVASLVPIWYPVRDTPPMLKKPPSHRMARLCLQPVHSLDTSISLDVVLSIIVYVTNSDGNEGVNFFSNE